MTYTDVLAARGTLDGALEALRVLGAGVSSVQSMDLAGLAVTATQVAAAARGLACAVTIEAGERGVIRESGSTGAAAWLTDAGAALTETDAHAIRRAIDTTTRPVLSGLRDALRTGDVTPSDAGRAASVFDELRTATDPAMHDEIAEAATTLARQCTSRRSLARFKTDMLARYGTLDSEERTRSHHAAQRGLSGFTEMPDGLYRLEGLLSPTDKATLDAALTALSAPVPNPEPGQIDTRLPRERRLDALMRMAELVGASTVTGPMGAGTRVNLTLPLDALARPCEHRAKDMFGLWRPTGEPCDCTTPVAAVDDLGTHLLPAYARELSCDAEVTPVWLGEGGQPLTHGRTERLASKGQRSALEVRDGGCSFPGCDNPASWSRVHHIVHWADGGATDADNLALLCGPHHRFVHRHDITGRVTPDGGRVEWDVVNVLGGWRPAPRPADATGPPDPADATGTPDRTPPAGDSVEAHGETPGVNRPETDPPGDHDLAT